MISIKFSAVFFLRFEGGETVSLGVLIKCCSLFYPSLERLDSPPSDSNVVNVRNNAPLQQLAGCCWIVR